MIFQYKCECCGHNFTAKAKNAKFCQEKACQKARKRKAAAARQKRHSITETASQMITAMNRDKNLGKSERVAEIIQEKNSSNLEQALEAQNKKIAKLSDDMARQNKINAVLVKKIKERTTESNLIKQKLCEMRALMIKLEEKFVGQSFSYRYEREVGNI